MAQTLVSRDLDPGLVQALFGVIRELGPGFGQSTLAKTDRWRFELVAFYHYYASWGVVLLEDKESGTWRSILRVPTGDSKNYPPRPENQGRGTRHSGDRLLRRLQRLARRSKSDRGSQNPPGDARRDISLDRLPTSPGTTRALHDVQYLGPAPRRGASLVRVVRAVDGEVQKIGGRCPTSALRDAPVVEIRHCACDATIRLGNSHRPHTLVAAR